jgi:hypothetical protein
MCKILFHRISLFLLSYALQVEVKHSMNECSSELRFGGQMCIKAYVHGKATAREACQVNANDFIFFHFRLLLSSNDDEDVYWSFWQKSFDRLTLCFSSHFFLLFIWRFPFPFVGHQRRYIAFALGTLRYALWFTDRRGATWPAWW